MPVFETYAMRQKRLKGELPDVYVYDTIPQPLRVQIVQIMHDQLGDVTAYAHIRNVSSAYEGIVTILRRELGLFVLPPTSSYANDGALVELTNYLLNVKEADDFLSAVELVCRAIMGISSNDGYRNHGGADENASEAIAEINARFKQHGLGYEYDDEIIRIDTELVHVEAVKPALALLRDPLYKGAEDEFLQAYAHYRKGNNKEAINEALKAFESTMKTILAKRQWPHNNTDPAAKLIAACFDNGLIPAFWQNHFNALRSTLEGGVPTGRNKMSGHGQGTEPTSVPDHLASYILHMTASTIVFLVNAEKALP